MKDKYVLKRHKEQKHRADDSESSGNGTNDSGTLYIVKDGKKEVLTDVHNCDQCSWKGR